MELRQLRFLLALAEERHFGRAAARMHISQPSFSAEIARLERELGVRLFDRTSRSVRLTPIGTRIRDLAGDVLAATGRLRDVADAAARGTAGTLRVGFVPTTAPDFLPRLLAAYRERHPEVTVQLYAAGLADPSAGLADGRVDVALIWPPISAPDLEQRELLREPRVALLAARHPLAGRDRLAFDEVRDLPTCVIRTDDPVWEGFWLVDELRAGRPAVRGPVADSYDGVLAAIAAGEGIGFPPVGGKAFGSGAPVVGVPVDGLPDAVLAAAWPTGADNPLTAGFVAVADEMAGEPAGVSAVDRAPDPV